MAQAEQFPDFFRAVSPRLLHTAWLLTGDRHRAEDLVQHALARTYAAWGRVRHEDATAYARRVLVNAHTDWWRRAQWREQPVGELPERSRPDETASLHDRDALVRALDTLGRRERLVVVLRYYADLDIESVADLLGISAGTVKSTSSRALAKLRVSTEFTHDGGSR